MTQPSAVRAARFALASMLVLTIGACAKSEKAPSDTSAAAAGTPAATDARALAAPTAAAKQPGDLPKPIDQMSGDELYTFTRTLTFGGGRERRRRCRGNPACRGRQPRDSTLVRVDAVETEDSLSTGNLAANGVIGARALNRGTLPDSMYNTRPGKDYEYYLIVTPAGPGVANWQLVELTTTPGARSHRSVASGAFHGCDHPFQRGARADFKSCARAAAETRPAALRMFQTDGEDPLWIGCAAGCCTADNPDGRG